MSVPGAILSTLPNIHIELSDALHIERKENINLLLSFDPWTDTNTGLNSST